MKDAITRDPAQLRGVLRAIEKYIRKNISVLELLIFQMLQITFLGKNKSKSIII